MSVWPCSQPFLLGTPRGTIAELERFVASPVPSFEGLYVEVHGVAYLYSVPNGFLPNANSVGVPGLRMVGWYFRSSTYWFECGFQACASGDGGLVRVIVVVSSSALVQLLHGRLNV
mmetsp:Transcript_24098/g.61586  ORF Transcript_24098/g.61586 Transcript_24098/m.61586 type:complete len:116 (-) Transcript_24098:96-443(-)